MQKLLHVSRFNSEHNSTRTCAVGDDMGSFRVVLQLFQGLFQALALEQMHVQSFSPDQVVQACAKQRFCDILCSTDPELLRHEHKIPALMQCSLLVVVVYSDPDWFQAIYHHYSGVSSQTRPVNAWVGTLAADEWIVSQNQYV